MHSRGLPVDIQGNQELSLSNIRRVIAISDMSSASVIATAVTGLYFDEGFVTARVEASEDAQHILVTIDEGARFSFGTLLLKGTGRGSLPVPPFRQGDVYSSSQVQIYLESLRGFYARANHEVALRSLTEMHEETKTIDIIIEIQGKDSDGPIHLAPVACVPTPDIGQGEALVLRRNQEVVLGDQRSYYFSRICVRDSASIRICSKAEIRVPGRVVIGGRGIGGAGSRPALLVFWSSTTNKIYMLFDNALGHVSASLRARHSPDLVYSITGHHGISFAGIEPARRKANRFRNDTGNFPACN